jgi:hypothetical protein
MRVGLGATTADDDARTSGVDVHASNRSRVRSISTLAMPARSMPFGEQLDGS